LNYSSQSGNGIAGVGWNVSGLSVITRCPATQATDSIRGGVNLDANDKLCMDGQRLMVQSPASYWQSGATYVTEIFNGSLVTQVGAAGPTMAIGRAVNQPPILGYQPGTGPLTAAKLKASAEPAINVAAAAAASPSPLVEFTVKTKAGELMEYSRADPWGTASTPAPTRMWLLTRVVDTFGNYWSVDYARDSANGEYTPAAINYTGNSKTGAAPYNKLEFVYEPRTDISNGYIGGYLLNNTKRLKTIRTWATLSGGTTQQKVTEYQLTYATSTATQRSLLTSVQEVAYDGVGVATTLNPVSFAATIPNANLVRLQAQAQGYGLD
jgi:hypothetical protein